MPRRVLEGKVVSNANDKTVTVLVERRFMHPMYKKYVKKSAKYAAHDEKNSFNVGDKVSIIECRPISKSKRWSVLENGVASIDAATKEAKAKKPAAKKAPEKKPAAKKADAKKDK
jgi:small subunit ribosomal protein S17